MDADKSGKIASRRFQNGNYLLSLNKYSASRKEFDVAYIIYSKLDMQKEMAEALNNIGITYVRDGMLKEAREYFERSYLMKKQYIIEPNESLFNTLHNLLGVCEKQDEEAYLRLYEEHKAAGEALGGGFLTTVEKEKAVYERISDKVAEKARIKEEEALSEKTPAEILEHLKGTGKPCVAVVRFKIRGCAIETPRRFTFIEGGSVVRITEITTSFHGDEGLYCPYADGRIEFDVTYEDMGNVIENGPQQVYEKALTYVKRLFGSLIAVRDDMSIAITEKNFSISSAGFNSATGKYVEAAGAMSPGQQPVRLTEEDCMLIDMTLSAHKFSGFKPFLLNARMLIEQEQYVMGIVNSMAGLEFFISMFLLRNLDEEDKDEYLKKPMSLIKKMRCARKLAQYGSYETLEALDDACEAIKIYGHAMRDGQASKVEAEKAYKAASRAIYALKSMYDL